MTRSNSNNSGKDDAMGVGIFSTEIKIWEFRSAQNPYSSSSSLLWPIDMFNVGILGPIYIVFYGFLVLVSKSKVTDSILIS